VTAFAWGSQPSRNFANYQGQGELDQWQYTAPVGQFSSNAYGLHDMAGNVWEWVDNCWRANYLVQTMDKSECEGHLRTRRGGAWDNQPPNMRPAYRSSGNELERSFLYGFRVARSLP
jgi:formylglycine-generating enzyme required for sulfatase activity